MHPSYPVWKRLATLEKYDDPPQFTHQEGQPDSKCQHGLVDNPVILQGALMLPCDASSSVTLSACAGPRAVAELSPAVSSFGETTSVNRPGFLWYMQCQCPLCHPPPTTSRSPKPSPHPSPKHTHTLSTVFPTCKQLSESWVYLMILLSTPFGKILRN